MKQSGHVTVTRLYVTPGVLIESAKVNCFCPTDEYAVDQFCKAVLWIKAIIQNKQ